MNRYDVMDGVDRVATAVLLVLLWLGLWLVKTVAHLLDLAVHVLVFFVIVLGIIWLVA